MTAHRAFSITPHAMRLPARHPPLGLSCVVSLFMDDNSTATRVEHRVGTFTQGKVAIDYFSPCHPR